jgi:general secretion pathway protein G
MAGGVLAQATIAMKHPPRTNLARRGFTLTEILVVVGIVVLLAAIGLPMVLRAYKSGNKMRVQADLNTIAVALNAYKQDFGEYPRVRDGLTPTGSFISATNTGAAVLAKALIGPYGDGIRNGAADPVDPPTRGSFTSVKAGQCVSDGGGSVALVDDAGAVGDPNQWAPFIAHDGHDGPGFKTRRGPGPNQIMGDFDDTFQGNTYGPYLPAEKFNVVGCMLRDSGGKPILYFPASAGKPNLRGQVQSPTGTVPGYIHTSEYSKYDANDNLVYFKRPGDSDTVARKAFRAAMGDLNDNGIIDAGETPATEDSFILWAAGPDGQYGPNRTSSTWTPTRQDVEKMDDVTSFSK